MPIVYHAKVPGSCMVLGEYAVLENYPAIVAGVDRMLEVTLMARDDHHIHIKSHLGEVFCEKTRFPAEPPFQFLAAVIRATAPAHGFTLTITAHFSETVGLGSSAAVTVGALACLWRYEQRIFTPKELLIAARAIIRTVQGCGSGADVAASVYGGLLVYHPQTVRVERLYLNVPLHLIYVGYKTPTPIAIQKVATTFTDDQPILTQLLRHINTCTKQAIINIRKNDLVKLGELMMAQQLLLILLGVSDELIMTLLGILFKMPGIYGAKISGSGLGDCLLAIGELPPHTFPQNEEQALQGVIQIDIALSSHGLELSEWAA